MHLLCTPQPRIGGALGGARAVEDYRACEESGYCSLGISKPWRGDIKDSRCCRLVATYQIAESIGMQLLRGLYLGTA